MKDVILRVLLDAPMCAFWCFVWHKVAHTVKGWRTRSVVRPSINSIIGGMKL